jgi:hypothetical protein
MTCRFSNLYYEAIERRNESPFKEWIKILPPNRMVPLDLYDRRDDFHKVANVVLDTDTKPNGTMCRQTVIKFETTISADDWKSQNEWLYLFVVDGKIVKIGGTRAGLKKKMWFISLRTPYTRAREEVGTVLRRTPSFTTLSSFI